MRENYYLPNELERRIAEWVKHYNTQLYHESLNNVTPANAYFEQAQNIPTKREIIKRKTIELHRRQHQLAAA